MARLQERSIFRLGSRLYRTNDHDTPILIQLDSGDNDLAGVNADGSGSTIRLITLHTVNVDDPFLTIHLGNFSFPTLVCPPNDPDLVIFADW